MPLLTHQSLGEVASSSMKIRNWYPRMEVHSITATRNCCLVPQLQSNRHVCARNLVFGDIDQDGYT